MVANCRLGNSWKLGGAVQPGVGGIWNIGGTSTEYNATFSKANYLYRLEMGCNLGRSPGCTGRLATLVFILDRPSFMEADRSGLRAAYGACMHLSTLCLFSFQFYVQQSISVSAFFAYHLLKLQHYYTSHLQRRCQIVYWNFILAATNNGFLSKHTSFPLIWKFKHTEAD